MSDGWRMFFEFSWKILGVVLAFLVAPWIVRAMTLYWDWVFGR